MRMTPSCATWSRWSGAFSRDGGGPGVGRAASGRAVCRTGKVHVHRRGVPGSGRFSRWGFGARSFRGMGVLDRLGSTPMCPVCLRPRSLRSQHPLRPVLSFGRPFAGEKTWGVQEPPRSPDAYPEPRLCGSIYRFCGCRSSSGVSVGWHSGVPVARRFGTSGAFDSQPPAQRGSTHSWHPGPGAPQSVSRPHPTPTSPSTRSSRSCLECTPSLA